MARQRQGIGQRIFVDMFGANAYANFDDCLAYPGKAPRRLPDRESFGIDPLWRLYPCATGWVFFGVADDAQWRQVRLALVAQLQWLAELPLAGARLAGQSTPALKDAKGRSMPPDVSRMVNQMNAGKDKE